MRVEEHLKYSLTGTQEAKENTIENTTQKERK